MYDLVVVGCGLSGMVVSRQLADAGYKVLVLEKRGHIGGNIYDEIDSNGFLIQKYGPHSFFTNEESIRPWVEKFINTEDCFIRCRTMINGLEIPMPFNYKSIDMIYEKAYAEELKKRLEDYFSGRTVVAVTELLDSQDEMIHKYGMFMYENEYKLYSAKQWGKDISEISPEVFNRVQVYLSYLDVYLPHKYQFIPCGGFTKFAEKLIEEKKIDVVLNIDPVTEKVIELRGEVVVVHWNNEEYRNIPVLYTGEIDYLLKYKYGKLPYRSLEFVWKLIDQEEYQETEITAYPQADKITRVTEYKKLPKQNIKGKTKISIEIPVPYDVDAPVGAIPYYPIKNDENDELYKKYLQDVSGIKNLYLCGRLADYKYINMDAVIMRAWDVANEIMDGISEKQGKKNVRHTIL